MIESTLKLQAYSLSQRDPDVSISRNLEHDLLSCAMLCVLGQS